MTICKTSERKKELMLSIEQENEVAAIDRKGRKEAKNA